MDRESAKSYIKNQLVGYLGQKGINVRKSFQCLNPEHTDKHPSMSYDNKRNKCHCFSCGADYDIIDLIKIEYGLHEDKDAFQQAYEMYHIILDKPEQQNKKSINIRKIEETEKIESEKKDYVSYFLKVHEKVKNTDYLTKRGLTSNTIDKFKLGYEENFTSGTGGKVWKCVIIPTTKYSYTARNIDVNADKKDRIRKVGQNVLFNVNAFSSSSPVFIVEGEFDALSIIEAGGEAISLGSVANYHKLIQYLQEKEIKSPLILIALDNDEEGLKIAEKMAAALKFYKKSKIIFLKNMYGQYKDANEMLIKDKNGLIQAVEYAKNILQAEKEEQAAEYKKNNAASHIKEFLDGVQSSINTSFIPTGFNELDNLLDGGLYEGLYIIGAVSSLGKTTFIMQIADQIAQNNQDVLIFSLEMARSEIMAKSISRLTFLDCIENNRIINLAKTSRGITTGKRYCNYSQEEKDIIQAAVARYGIYAENIYIYEGIGDIGVEQIKETVKTHISITGNTPVVIIDYLQILSPHDIRATDKQNTDKAVLELKRLSRDYKTPVIGISSLNRQSYNSPIGMEAFKESGAIEYSSDVLIGMQFRGVGEKDFDLNGAKKKEPREVEVIVLKNRNGRTGNKLLFNYYPMFNYFTSDFENCTINTEVKVYPSAADGFQQMIMDSITPFSK